MKITLLGAGAWGTALSIAFAGKHELTLWSREADVAADLLATRENHRFFPGYKLPESVAVATDFEAAVAGAELLIVATPIAGLRPTVERLKAIGSTLPVLWVCKGFELYDSNITFDYVSLYDHRDKYFLPMYTELQSRIFHTPTHHWRTAPSSCASYIAEVARFRSDYDIFQLGLPDYYLFNALNQERKRALLTPIPGLSTHAMEGYLSPTVDWASLLV